jgi:hypothetical protein
MTSTEFLRDTVAHYNSSNRSTRTNTRGGCTYSPAHPLTKGCAIGRHLAPEDAAILDNTKSGASMAIGAVYHTDLIEMLPAWMQVMDPDFLTEAQNLHDRAENWTPAGLSEKGRLFTLEICERHDINPADIFPATA